MEPIQGNGGHIEFPALYYQGMREMQARHPLIGDVRCPGLMVAIELVADRDTKQPATVEATQIPRLAPDRGVIFGESRYGALGNLIRIKPPLDIPDETNDRSDVGDRWRHLSPEQFDTPQQIGVS